MYWPGRTTACIRSFAGCMQRLPNSVTSFEFTSLELGTARSGLPCRLCGVSQTDHPAISATQLDRVDTKEQSYGWHGNRTG